MLRKKKSSAVKSVAIGASIAAVAGYVAGILTAPKSGKQTRKDISRAAKKNIKRGEKEYQKLHKEVEAIVADVKAKSSKATDKTTKELNDLVTKAKDTKTKVADVINAVKNGEAEDKELKKAVTEATKALENVKKYLKK